MLADLQPDVLRIDMALTRAINTDPCRTIGRIDEVCASLERKILSGSDPAMDAALAHDKSRVGGKML